MHSIARAATLPCFLFPSVLVPAQAPTWQQPTVLQGTSQHAVATDTARQRIVLFGGEIAPSQAIDQTWEWDGNVWLRRQPAVAPARRLEHALAFDTARARVVLFGGRDGATLFGDTWEWDGRRWQQAATTGPSPRAATAMAYDEARGRVVLFGDAASGDTWEWDGTTWTQRTPASSPSARTGHRMAYDTARQRVMLFGGYVAGAGWRADLWEWDGTQWTQRPGSGPAGRNEHAMAYDPARGVLVVYGGFGSGAMGATWYDDTWEWNGASWIQRAASTPSKRSGTAMAYDPVRQSVIAFGGRSGSQSFAETWEWVGGAWRRLYASAPSARYDMSMAHDRLRSRTVLFGGGFDAEAQQETWEWDGTAWQPHTPALRPPARTSHRLVHDLARQRTVLFGGTRSVLYNDTWEWDGTTWTLHAPAASPPGRMDHALAYDEARRRVVLFGGLGAGLFSDTWEWDGTTWTQLTPPNRPSARRWHAMAYDPTSQRVVLFGGSNVTGIGVQLDDTWLWDGSNWTQHPFLGPTRRTSHAMTTSAGRQSVLMYGGGNNVGSQFVYLNDTQEWRGNSWTGVIVSGTAPARNSPAMAYDERRARLVVFGGSTGGGLRGETWTLGMHVLARADPTGTACGGTNGLPFLTGNVPTLGTAGFVLDLLSARPSAACVFGLAAASQNLPIGGGCTFYLAGPLVLLPHTTNGTGFASVRLGVPDDPSLLGGTFYAQAFVADPLGPAFGLATSEGRRLIVGD